MRSCMFEMPVILAGMRVDGDRGVDLLLAALFLIACGDGLDDL